MKPRHPAFGKRGDEFAGIEKREPAVAGRGNDVLRSAIAFAHPKHKKGKTPCSCHGNSLPIVIGNRATDETPQQDSLSGVIICPAKYMEGQRLRVNSVTARLIVVHH